MISTISLGCISCSCNSHGSSSSTIQEIRAASCVDEYDSYLSSIVGLSKGWDKSKKIPIPALDIQI